jgi:uncharacterized protein (TIGR04255 family)
MKFPRKIDPCPLREAVAEIRFDSTWPGDAVFGVVYSAVREKYPKSEKLPVLQVPEVVRTNDPGFTYLPYYRLIGEGFLIQIGPKVVSVITQEPYPGWERFVSEIQQVFETVKPLGFIDKVTRFAIRYINFFTDLDVFKNIKLGITLDGKDFTSNQMFFRTIVNRDRFHCLLQVGNDTQMQKDESVNSGSIIDIDTYWVNEDAEFFEQMGALLQEAHDVEKELFFSLLRTEFFNTLNPIY